MRLRLKRWIGRRSPRALIGLAAAAAISLVATGGVVAVRLGGTPKPPVSSTDIALQRGLIGHWMMDGNAKDSTPYGNNGTATAVTLTSDRKGQASTAYDFNSASDLISVPYTPVHWPTAGITVSIWVKPGNMAKTTVQSFIGNQQNGGFNLLINADGAANCPAGLKWVMEVNAVQRSNCISKTILTDGIWYHIVGTYDGSDIKLYVNNVLQDTDNWPGTLTYTSTTTPLCFGLVPGASSCSGGNYVGVMDDVRLYDRAISQAEVTKLYESYNANAQLASGDNGLVGQWKLDGNAKDSSPYGNNGTVTGAALTSDRKGQSNSGYVFTGNPDNIRVPYNAILNPTSRLTVSQWFKANTAALNAAQSQRLATTLSGGNGYGFVVTGTSSADPCGTAVLCFRLKSNATNLFATTPISGLTNGVWYHVVGTFDGTNARLYVNGALAGTSASAAGSITYAATTSLCFGASPNANISCNADYLTGNGALDDIRIYNRAYSLTEITALYSSYNSQVSVSSLQNGLVGYWPLNGNAKDATPNAANGTVANATLTTDRKGRANSAYSFDGTGDFITATHPSLPGSTAPQSITAWIKPGTLISNKNIMLISNSTPNQELRFRTGSTANLAIANIAGLIDNTVDVIPSTNVWHHVAFTWDGTNSRLYINGVLDSGGADATPLQASNAAMNTVAIGKGAVGSQDFLGSIDDVRIYNRALSGTEIADLVKIYN